MTVRFQFGGYPEEFYSWRGSYDQLTLTVETGEPVTVAELRETARGCDGQTFTGYKGGEFPMDLSTQLWADDYGVCPGNRIEAIAEHEGQVILITDAQAWLNKPKRRVRIRFDGPPGPVCGRFIESEDADTGASISLGDWSEDPLTGNWFLTWEQTSG